MATTAQDKIRTLAIERRYYKEMKITESDARWLLHRSERLLTADGILAELGYKLQDDEMSYQMPMPDQADIDFRNMRTKER